jgi:hypothetical protein
LSKPHAVDSNLPRGKAAFHAIFPALAFLIGGETGVFIVAATGLAMAASVLLGPRFSLFGRLFQKVIRPALRIGEGKKDDAAPHRFAEALGAVFLIAASLALALGASLVGSFLTLAVAALAALNWLAGICVGCQMYLLFQRFKTRAIA